jgi:hypothetical protein
MASRIMRKLVQRMKIASIILCLNGKQREVEDFFLLSSMSQRQGGRGFPANPSQPEQRICECDKRNGCGYEAVCCMVWFLICIQISCVGRGILLDRYTVFFSKRVYGEFWVDIYIMIL